MNPMINMHCDYNAHMLVDVESIMISLLSEVVGFEQLSEPLLHSLPHP
jgi:hypothetical protein